MERTNARYRFGLRERGGALAGWRAGQILTVALGLLIGVVVLRSQPDVTGVGVAFVILLICVALATWPVSGRTGDQWIPVVVRWSARQVRGPGQGSGLWPGPGRSAGWRRRGTDALCGLCLLSVGPRDLGVVHDVRARTLTAVLSLRGQSFALLGPDDQDRRVAGWSVVLAALAREGSPVRRVQWLAATFPDAGQGPRDYLREHRVAEPASPCAASYQSLLGHIDADASTHDVSLAVQVRMGKSLEAGCEALQREINQVVRQLGEADVDVQAVLPADGVADLLLRTYEPHRVPRAPGRPATQAHADPWPMALAEEWSILHVDGMVHATFWVAEWPRTEVHSDFLAPLLLSPARATLSVVMEPLGPEKALRKVEASRTADLADAELRRRSGFVSTARHARESEVLARREAELADGHASFRYAGFVTVSAPNEAELAVACDAVQHAAGQCRLLLRRLYGDQAGAYTCTLPLARGLT